MNDVARNTDSLFFDDEFNEKYDEENFTSHKKTIHVHEECRHCCSLLGELQTCKHGNPITRW